MGSQTKIYSVVFFFLLLIATSTPAQEPARLSFDFSLWVTSGAPTIIPVRLVSDGSERAVSFSVAWTREANLRYVRVYPAQGAPADMVISVDQTRSPAGRLGITLTSATGFASGSKQLVRIVMQGGEPEVGQLRVDYVNSPTPIRVTGANGEPVPVTNTGFAFSGPGVADFGGAALWIGERSATSGRTITFPVSLSQGFGGFQGMSNLTFSLQWDPEYLEFQAARAGDVLPPGATVTFDESLIASGRLGVTVAVTSPFVDTIQYRPVQLAFRARPTAPLGIYPISFGSSPIAMCCVGSSPGFINTGVTYSFQDGTVRTPDGLALRNATVTLTDDTGFSWTTTTSSFGTFRFNYFPNISNYTLTVRSKRYRFAPVTIIPTGGLLQPLEIRGLE
jgi:hypothetical protein